METLTEYLQQLKIFKIDFCIIATEDRESFFLITWVFDFLLSFYDPIELHSVHHDLVSKVGSMSKTMLYILGCGNIVGDSFWDEINTNSFSIGYMFLPSNFPEELGNYLVLLFKAGNVKIRLGLKVNQKFWGWVGNGDFKYLIKVYIFCLSIWLQGYLVLRDCELCWSGLFFDTELLYVENDCFAWTRKDLGLLF